MTTTERPRPGGVALRRAGVALAALACLRAGPLAAQAERTATVAPGPEYAADGVRAFLLGEDWRELWTTPIRVPVLDLGRFAGGLEPTERSGGRQTRGLRFRGADGFEYQFRSVNKFPRVTDEPAIDGTVVADLVQDQVSSIHPAAGVVAAHIARAAGVLHVVPQLAVLPDDPALGEFREEFAGMLGTIELRPDEAEGDDAPRWEGFQRITGTERLLERLAEGPDDRVDERAYLRARLVDLLLGDWDRHEDQWRWGESEAVPGMDLWIPIPRDRDFALVDYDGVLMGVLRQVVRNAVEFTPGIPDVYGLTLNARDLDRLLLAGLPRSEWDAIAADVQRRVTDQVIRDAVGQMPAEYHPLVADRLVRTLVSRRDDLAAAAGRFYALLSQAVDVRATDAPERLRVRRLDGGRTEVALFGHDEDTGAPLPEPYYRRVFEPRETEEVRVFLRGGDDRAVVHGDAPGGVPVRIVGGEGDDVLADSSSARAGWTGFYDAEGKNTFVRGPRTVVDTRPYAPPADSSALSGEAFRDWGSGWSVQPYADYKSTEGVILGGGPVFTQRGFRRYPYAYRVGGRVMVALESWGLGADAFGDFRRVNSPVSLSFYARASQLESFRFFGFGNDTPRGSSALATVPQDQIRFEAALTRPVAGVELSVGPVLKYSRPELRPGSPLDLAFPLGSEAFGQVGVQAGALLDRRDDETLPRAGFSVEGSGAFYPAAWDAADAFARGGLEAGAYLPLPLPLDPTLALRAGGERVWGGFPVHEAAFVGGSGSVRGYSYQRFAGDASLYGSAELRAPLLPVELILKGDLGALLLADAGRVWFDGDSPGGWHASTGAGLWFDFTLRDRQTVLTVAYARGEKHGLYFDLGMPF